MRCRNILCAGVQSGLINARQEEQSVCHVLTECCIPTDPFKQHNSRIWGFDVIAQCYRQMIRRLCSE